MVKKSFKKKIIVPTVLVFVAFVIFLNIFLLLRFSAISSYLISEKLVANTNSLILYLDNSRVNSKAAAVSMAINAEAVNAINERDRRKILQIFTPTHDLYGVNYYTITDGEGIVLARTHDPDNFGDSVINQQNVRDALDGEVMSYFEAGTVVRVSVRTGVPVYNTDGALIGVISAGVRFDTDDTVEELKELLQSEVSVFLGDTRIATTIIGDGYRQVDTKLTPRIAEVVIANKQEYTGDADILGVKHVTFYKPLLNAQEEAYAIFALGIPMDGLAAKSTQSIRDGIILGLVGLAISITLLFFIISAISKPITTLQRNMEHIANGNLGIEIDVVSEDEIGDLGVSLQKIADTLNKLHEDINVMLAELEKGNTEHFINTEIFNGDYKMLAGNISELASISTIDHLTGIPNRRSFNNRLDLEWKRALRGQSPLVIMMIDIDHFKNYNDTFGHQQGDVALKTVAGTIKRSLKRATDFTARWGGEEFVVLLPDTNSGGAMSFAENLRAEVENAVIPSDDKKAAAVTVSIGVNTQIPTQDSKLHAFISAADAALYKAKNAGRNRVTAAGE